MATILVFAYSVAGLPQSAHPSTLYAFSADHEATASTYGVDLEIGESDWELRPGRVNSSIAGGLTFTVPKACQLKNVVAQAGLCLHAERACKQGDKEET